MRNHRWASVVIGLLTGCSTQVGADTSCAVLAREAYRARGAERAVPLLRELVAFPTIEGQADAFARQSRWLERMAHELGLGYRGAGPVVEIELPGPSGAPVLGLVVHGDVVPVDPSRWSSPPFRLTLTERGIRGRGVADDKGPLVVALLALRALAETGQSRTYTVRLLVGSDEEAGGHDMESYLRERTAPALSLVLDSQFPVVVGEKAWDLLVVRTALGERAPAAFRVVELDAGLAASIVPDQARIVLEWAQGPPDWAPVAARVAERRAGEDLEVSVEPSSRRLHVAVSGHSAHAGVNLEGGRNALVGLARLMEGVLPAGGADDLLTFARLAGKDLHGGGLGLTRSDPLWGRYDVNVAMLRPEADGLHSLSINLRRIPPLSAEGIRAHLERQVADFERRTGARLETTGSYFEEEPLVFDPEAPLVGRLLAAYERATGERHGPVVSGGGTYAKRLPRAIAFGMWFPGAPYPGHDVDEQIRESDLQLGAHVLLEALGDLVCSPPLAHPFGTP